MCQRGFEVHWIENEFSTQDFVREGPAYLPKVMGEKIAAEQTARANISRVRDNAEHFLQQNLAKVFRRIRPWMM
jgi:hypothetical protein